MQKQDWSLSTKGRSRSESKAQELKRESSRDPLQLSCKDDWMSALNKKPLHLPFSVHSVKAVATQDVTEKGRLDAGNERGRTKRVEEVRALRARGPPSRP
eukprot:3341724-Pleurochrysis_carterae.AAC.2